MVDHATLQTDPLGHAFPGPERAAEAIGGGTAGQQDGQLRELIGRESATGSGRWPVAQGPWATQAGARHPLADSGFADPQGFGHLALRPALLLEVPGLVASCCFPGAGWRIHP